MKKNTFNKFLTMMERTAANAVFVTRQDNGENIWYYICNGFICLRVDADIYKNYIEDKKPYLIGLPNNSTVSSAGGGCALAEMIELEKFFTNAKVNRETKYTRYKRAEHGEYRTKMIFSDGEHLTYIDEQFLIPAAEFLDIDHGRTGERSIDPILFSCKWCDLADKITLFVLPVRIAPDEIIEDVDLALLKMGA